MQFTGQTAIVSAIFSTNVTPTAKSVAASVISLWGCTIQWRFQNEIIVLLKAEAMSKYRRTAHALYRLECDTLDTRLLNRLQLCTLADFYISAKLITERRHVWSRVCGKYCIKSSPSCSTQSGWLISKLTSSTWDEAYIYIVYTTHHIRCWWKTTR